jgi:hypothetical protein
MLIAPLGIPCILSICMPGESDPVCRVSAGLPGFLVAVRDFLPGFTEVPELPVSGFIPGIPGIPEAGVPVPCACAPAVTKHIAARNTAAPRETTSTRP